MNIKFTNDIYQDYLQTKGTWSQKAEQMNDNGYFFNEQSLRKAVTRFERKNFDYDYVTSDDASKIPYHSENDSGHTPYGLDKINEMFKDELPEVVENHGKKFYVFKIWETESATGQKYEIPVSISVETVDQICFDFSSYGANLTQQQILNKYGLNARAWTVLKSRLNLTKLSDAVSKQTLSEADSNGTLETVIEFTTDKSLNSKAKAIFERKHKQMKESRFKALEKKVAQVGWVAQELSEALKNRVVKLPEIKIGLPSFSDYEIIFISDMHF